MHSRLPDTKFCFAQTILFSVSAGLDTSLAFVEAHIGIQPCHADVDARLSRDAIWVALLALAFVKNVFRPFEHICVVVLAPCHG